MEAKCFTLTTRTTPKEVFSHISKRMKYGAPDLKVLYQKFVTRSLTGLVALAVITSVQV